MQLEITMLSGYAILRKTNNIFSCICKIQNFICIWIYTRGGPNTRTGITRMVEMLREGGNTDGKGI